MAMNQDAQEKLQAERIKQFGLNRGNSLNSTGDK